MISSLDLCLDYLNLSKIPKRKKRLIDYEKDGNRLVEVHTKDGDVNIFEVERLNGRKDYVVCKWNNYINKYDIVYDPYCSRGIVRLLLSAYIVEPSKVEEDDTIKEQTIKGRKKKV